MTAARSKMTADLHRRVWPDRPGPLRAEAEFPNYTPAERRVDAIVHMIGLALALAGCIALAVTALPGADLARLVGLGLYAVGLLAMLGCSALYNLIPAVRSSDVCSAIGPGLCRQRRSVRS